ncbi:16S rRNA (cytidine(1402)-2'-O)-methyltransferase [Oceanobacillus chungangensis]|uniref:Ribosomal RNA small subunit methyltransferase I n=1 Tax=Oceanobacillus chungangensis TaxID=1229152 RepID=A0A3D8PMT4_9BACI|nr:16S rRNA (cytidine(1402)-2'-O)-methyltransferase [Oceanobacillus chungangensis]RDW16837.1 16S rRNA (cytidine(1402)-2'-O)-methyltransferase [Oceanobacillus chungangensis]
MKIQKSFDDETLGTIYVVPTPIGNLEDITFRALKVLKSVTVIAAEDTRNTKKLLNHFEIQTPLISYHEHNKLSREEQLLSRVESGESIAIVSDAGMPAISDPGFELVQSAIERNLKVVVLPGANAALCALVGSGLPANEFYFYGFLPRKKKDKEAELERLKQLKATLLFYESPYRIKDTLSAINTTLGNRQVVLARELTKRFEEFARGTADELLTWASDHELKGEFCIVVQGSDTDFEEVDDIWWSHLSVVDHVNYYIDDKQLSSKDAIKQVAVERKMHKREVYQTYHVE